MIAGVLLLAAGSARRFGSDKRRARLDDGRPLLATCIDNVRGSGLPFRVCLGANDWELAGELRAAGAACLTCPGAARGMGGTLSDAVRQCPAAWQGVLVALADMPWIRPATFSAVAAALAPDAIVIPRYRGERGHPVGFGGRFLAELAALDGDRGAREVVERHRERVLELAVDDPGIVRDVDTPDMLPGGPRSA